MSRFPAGSLVAVTGANGYIGSHIVQQLLAKGYRVRAIVRDPTNPTKVAHLRALPHAAERLELTKGELREEDYVRAFAGAAAVIHAASPYVYQADDADRDIVQPAIKGTVAAMRAALANKIQRIVVTSSTAAVMYAPLPSPNYKFSDKDWNLSATVTNGPYMLSKRLAEQAAWDIAKEHKELELVVINPCLVFGPSIAGEKNINTSLNNLRLTLMGQPNPFIPLDSFRPLVDVRDVAAAHLIGLEHPNARDKRLIVTADVVGWSELAAMLKRLYPKYPNTTPLPESHPAPYSVDTTPLAELGLRTYISTEQMVRDTVESMIANNLIPRM